MGTFMRTIHLEPERMNMGTPRRTLQLERDSMHMSIPTLLQKDAEDEDTLTVIELIDEEFPRVEAHVNNLADEKDIFQRSLHASSIANKSWWHGDPLQTTKHIELDYKFNLSVGGNLGYGASGWVQQVQLGDRLFVRKQLRRKADATREQMIRIMKDETNNMEKCSHRHTVKLLGTLVAPEEDDDRFNIFTSPVAVCNLKDYLDEYGKVCDGKVPFREARKLLRATLGNAYLKYLPTDQTTCDQYLRSVIRRRLDELPGCLATVVAWIHSKKIRHFDLKPENVVLSAGEVYVTDFGISWDLGGRTQSNTEAIHGGTPGFYAPEAQWPETKYSPARADIYSLGCILLHIAALRYQGNRKRCTEVLSKPSHDRGLAITEYIAELADLPTVRRMYERAEIFNTPRPYLLEVKRMLALDPKRRPCLDEVNKFLRKSGGPEEIYHGLCCKRNEPHADTSAADDTIKNMEQLLGTSHPDVLHRLSLLVGSLVQKADFAKASELNLVLWKRRSNTLGPNHPDTIDSITSQASIFQALHRPRQAENYLRNALDFRKNTLGEMHPMTLRCMDELAGLLSLKDKPATETEELLRKTLRLKRQALGETYHGTLRTMHQLALALCRQGRLSKAEELLTEEACILESQESHNPLLLRCLFYLAHVQRHQDKYEAAEETRQRALKLKRSIRAIYLGEQCSPYPQSLNLASPKTDLVQSRSKLKINSLGGLWPHLPTLDSLAGQKRSRSEDDVNPPKKICSLRPQMEELSLGSPQKPVMYSAQDQPWNPILLANKPVLASTPSRGSSLPDLHFTMPSDDASSVECDHDNISVAAAEDGHFGVMAMMLSKHHRSNTLIDSWLFEMLSQSRRQVRLLADTLQNTGVALTEAIGKQIIDMWYSNREEQITVLSQDDLERFNIYLKEIRESSTIDTITELTDDSAESETSAYDTTVPGSPVQAGENSDVDMKELSSDVETNSRYELRSRTRRHGNSLEHD